MASAGKPFSASSLSQYARAAFNSCLTGFWRFPKLRKLDACGLGADLPELFAALKNRCFSTGFKGQSCLKSRKI
jgi:hypothetical protein